MSEPAQSPTAEQYLPTQCRLGEQPVWSASEQALYWLDIENKAYFRHDPATGQTERFQLDVMPGSLAPRGAGGLILPTSGGIALVDAPGQQPRIVANPIAGQADMRFNDGKVDRKGRFWTATIAMTPELRKTKKGTLYRFDPDLSLHEMDTGFTESNGMGWSPDVKTMYFTDSESYVIYAYDFDVESGAIANRRPFVTFDSSSPTVPDGLTVDGAGAVWSAHWGGGYVEQYDPSGALLQRITLPAKHVTCPTFGGANLNDLFITTAWSGLSDAERQQQPQAGDLFIVRGAGFGQVAASFLG